MTREPSLRHIFVCQGDEKNHKRTNVPHASGGYRTAGMVTWRHVKLKLKQKPVKRTGEGTENRPLFPQNGPKKEHSPCVTGVMDSARSRPKKSLENTIKKLSENTEYGILYHGFL